MTDPTLEVQQQRFFSVAARLADRQRISRVEELWLRDYLDRYGPPQPADQGFPKAPSGDAGAPNNLRRTNWFNGRFLTAEALSRQDVYFDHRARLNAQALMPGIAWGLGIAGEGLNRLSGRGRRGGLEAGSPLTLRRGLAFDGVGRPILVSQDFGFTLADLIGVSVKTPRRVVGGLREFMPCVCLAPDQGGPSGGSAALPSGPYLLVIEAGEVPEGRAKVTGDVCGGRRSTPCEAEAWRGSFGLALVRFPVDAPLLNLIPDVWALRGTLAAYYFDVFEHPLWKRWDPAFPIDDSFRRDSGPGRHEGIAIPLALVHLGEDGTALYLDSWIPRRLITATPGEDWHRTRFGAPPRAAAWARVHQFQAMLQESLAVRPMAGTAPAEENLHGRGFRHIPPIGFLPVVSRPVTAEGNQGRQRLTTCTRFRDLQETDAAPNPYRGDQADFEVEGPNTRNNWILRRSGVTGLILEGSERLMIRLAQPAEQVTLRLQVNPDGNVSGGTGTVVTALGSADATGQRPTLARQEIQQPSRLEAITLTSPGIESVMVRAKHQTVLLEFCFDYFSIAPPSSAAPSRAALVREALRQGEAYFAGTNVVPYGVVALHDDDILEDLHNVIDKDPLQLEQVGISVEQERKFAVGSFQAAGASDRLATLSTAGVVGLSEGWGGVARFLLLLGVLLRRQGLEIDPLVNRRTEVVKLMVPLQGLSRRHPLLGALPEDAARQAAGWGLAGPADPGAASVAGMRRERGFDILPRPFVVYVTQRLVLLDLVFQLLEVLQKLVAWLLSASGQWIGGQGVALNDFVESEGRASLLARATTSDYRLALRAQAEDDQLLIRSTLAQPVVQQLLLHGMATATPSLARVDRSQRFLVDVERASEELPAEIRDTQERQTRALGQVADAWAAEFPDAQVLQLLAAVQPPQLTLELVERLGAQPGAAAGPTVADGLDLKPPSRFETGTSRLLYAEARRRLEERPLRELVEDLPEEGLAASLTVGDVLARSPQEAESILGGSSRLQDLRAAFRRERQEALEAANGLADGAPQDLVASMEGAVSSGEQPAEVLDRLRAEEEAKPQPDARRLQAIGHATSLLRVSGNRIEALSALRRQPGR